MSAIGVVLGSGLGAFADTLSDRTETPYSQIPGWPESGAPGHAGKLVRGKLGSREVIALAGRAHLYEGYSAQQVAFGIRELHKMGARSVVLTNAAGGINLEYQPGDLVLLSDHINLMGANPLMGRNDDSLGPRFPDMSDAYNREYRAVARATAADLGIELKEGIYAAMAGPSYETPAEIRFLRIIGADLIGMSTVPETIAANYLGMKVLAISCVTNMAAGILPQRLVHSEVMETGARVRDTLARLLHALISRLE